MPPPAPPPSHGGQNEETDMENPHNLNPSNFSNPRESGPLILASLHAGLVNFGVDLVPNIPDLNLYANLGDIDSLTISHMPDPEFHWVN